MTEAIRNLIRVRLEAGDPFEAVESELERLGGPLGEEQRAALWLYAWSLSTGMARQTGSPPLTPA